MAAGQDIFGYKRSPKPHGVFSTEGSKLVFGNAPDVGHDQEAGLAYLVQNWSVQYTQQVQELFEIGSNALYWAKGRPAGAGQLGRVLGGAAVDTEAQGFFPREAYDVCLGGASMVLEAHGGHCENPLAGANVLDSGVKITMDGCVVTSIGFSMQVGDVRLVENFGWRFAYMELAGT